MINYILNKENFYTDLFENEKISDMFEVLMLPSLDKSIFKSEKNIYFNNKINSIQLVPCYLTIGVHKKLKRNIVFQKKGYAVDLKGYKNVGEYLKANCSTSTKKNTLRSIKKLETCFSVHYKMYYGNIEFETYSFLMKSLLDMLVKRFQLRTGRNRVIENWDYYLSKCYNLILNKKASIFAIYNGNDPIKLTLNFHYDSIVYSAISSYDIDFSKFSLGNIDNYKELEWCIENKFIIFDLGYGDFSEKKSWCNLIYNFNTHVVYMPNQKLGKAFALVMNIKYKLINYLISKNINTLYTKFKSLFKKNKKDISSSFLLNKTETIDINLIAPKHLDPIHINNNKYSYLKKNIYDFIYKNNEHIDNILIFKLITESNAYIFKGKNNSIKINYTNK